MGHWSRYRSVVTTAALMVGVLAQAAPARADLAGVGATTTARVQEAAGAVTAPEVTTPEVTAPEVTAPEVSVPQVTAPKVTVPKVTVPNVTVPNVTVPKATAPKATAPKATAPKVTAPKATAPRATAPKASGPQSSGLTTAGHEAARRVRAASGGAAKVAASKPAQSRPVLPATRRFGAATATTALVLQTGQGDREGSGQRHQAGRQRLLGLDPSCLTPSLQPDDLRRCARALVLGRTGGVLLGLPLAGLLLVLGGSVTIRRGRRPVRLALAS